MKDVSLRWKLVFGSALIEIVMLTLLVANNVRLIENSLHEQVNLRLRELSVFLNAALAPSMAQLDYGSIQGIFSQNRHREGITYFVLFDKNDKAVASDGWPDNMPWPAVQAEIDVRGGARRFDTEIPISIGEQVYGRLQFGISTDFLHLARENLVRQSLLIALLEIVLSVFLLFLLGVWLTRHLTKLKAASIAVSEGYFDVTVQVDSADEIGRVGRAFNRMTQEINRKLSELSASETFMRGIFDNAAEGIWVIDTEKRTVRANKAMLDMLGVSEEGMRGKSIFDFVDEENAAILRAHAEQTQRVGVTQHYEIRLSSSDGRKISCMINSTPLRDIHGRITGSFGMVSDITPMMAHQEQLERIAHFDALTNLPNRVLLADRLSQAIAQSQRHQLSLALLYLDLDGFKAINDSHGHEIGDQLLVTMAQRMKATLREGDTLSRIGGDEFVAVLVDLEKPEDCEPVLTRLLNAAASPLTLSSALLQVSASIGVTIYPKDGVDADQLLRHADQAMYLAKQAGKNRYHLFDVEHDAAVLAQRESQEHIRQALERGQFVLYYQPKVNMRTGEIVGAEALIRWQHPERGLLPPAVFLPVIENHPLGVELGEWVIAAALSQMDQWHAAGLDLSVSVNVGARQLQQVDFVPRLRKLLATHPQLRPDQLELEILETSALEDIAQISELMYACLELGVGFALDDFGTGYSSLTYLKRLPAKLLKIDQSFVLDMIDDSEDLAIVQGVIGLANAFGRQVIAEGVETVAHGTLLLRLGCELAQGYGIARPMPAEQMIDWAASWRPDADWMTCSA